MNRPIILSALLALALCAAMPASQAATEWVEWSRVVGTSTDANGIFSDGRSILVTVNISSIRPTGEMYTTDPAVPGRPDGTNPSYILAPTGVPGEMIFTDEVIAVFDLSGFPVDAETVLGLADMVGPAVYRIEILDAANNPLSLTNVEVNNYNIFYPPSANSFIADYNIDLDPMTGLLSVNTIHDANMGSNYVHSGLTTFSNLPVDAAMIRILSGQDQLSEGVQWYFGGSAVVPVPPALLLFGSGLAALFGMGRRR